ncbi:MAG: sulfotransferase [Planctomycetes bacterium]|nr:sulfotransferase [Planctomycetota bacterium]NOG54306.1 sulfotransferase [Planctomycetota bacterium]
MNQHGKQQLPFRYFFIVGQARSGTNWTCNLLNLHPAINCHGEYHFERLFDGVQQFTAGPHGLGYRDESLRRRTHEWFQDFVRASLDAQVGLKPNATWMGDRTPRPLIPLLPDCPHLLVIRDVRDLIVSRVHHVYRNGGPRHEPFKTRLQPEIEAFCADPDYFKKAPEKLSADREWIANLASNWARRMRFDLDAAAEAKAGNAPLPMTVLSVRYEDLHADTDGQRRRMYELLDLDPALAAPLGSETKTSAGFAKENPHDLYRKGQVGDWTNYATDPFRTIIKEHAGDMLIELGYEQDHSW